MSTWIAVLGVALGSFVLRAAPLVLGGRLLESPTLQRTADLAATAALSALVATALVGPRSTGDLADAVAAAAALSVAGVLAHRGRALSVVLVAGLVVHRLVLAALPF